MKQYPQIEKHMKTLCRELTAMDMITAGMMEPMPGEGANGNIFTKKEQHELDQCKDLNQQSIKAFALFKIKPDSVYKWFEEYLINISRKDMVDLMNGNGYEEAEDANTGMADGLPSTSDATQSCSGANAGNWNGIQRIARQEPSDLRTVWKCFKDWWSGAPTAIRKFNDELKTWYKDVYAADTSGINKRGDKRVDDIFVPLTCLDIFDGAEVKEPVTLNYREIVTRLRDRKTKVGRICIISGEAGMGKTTVVKKICHEWATNTLHSSHSTPLRLVLCIPLRYLKPHSNHETVLAAALQFYKDDMSKWFPSLQYTTSQIQSYCSALENEKNILFILDGFDEYTGHSDQIDMLSQPDFDPNFCGCLIVTTRPLGMTHLKAMLYHFSLEGFTEPLVTKFVQKYVDRNKQPNELITRLEEKNLKKLAKVPILLKTICDIWEINRELPPTERELYDKFLEYLFQRAQSKEHLSGDVTMESKKHMLTIIGQLAYQHLMDRPEGKLTFDQSSFNEDAHKFLVDVGLLFHHDFQHHAKQMHSSHLTPAHSVFSFAHKSFQEYMAARFVEHQIQLTSELFQPNSMPELKEMINICRFIDNPSTMTNIVLKVKSVRDRPFEQMERFTEYERKQIDRHLKQLCDAISLLPDHLADRLQAMNIFNNDHREIIGVQIGGIGKALRIIAFLKYIDEGKKGLKIALEEAGCPSLYESIVAHPGDE